MASPAHIRQKLLERFPEAFPEHDELRINCGFCPRRVGKTDTKQHLYVNPGKNKFFCFRCDSKGMAEWLVPGIKYEFDPFLYDPSKPVTERAGEVDAVEALPDNIVDLNELPDDHSALLYLRSRVPHIDLGDAELYFCDDYRRRKLRGTEWVEQSFGPRIIIPIFHGGEYKGFQARSPGEEKTNDIDLRYVNGVNFKKSTSLFNWNHACQSSRLIITEGVFDAWQCGESAVAVFGKFLSKYQQEMIAGNHFEEIYTFLDRDALQFSKKLARHLVKYTRKSFYMNYADKDPGKMDKLMIEQLLNHHTVWPDFGAIQVY